MTEDHAALKAAADEYYRGLLADWMIKHDIATGGEAHTFEELLKVLDNYIGELIMRLARLEEKKDAE